MQRALFFDSTISVAWPGSRTPVRSEQKIRVEMFREKGSKGVKFKAKHDS